MHRRCPPNGFDQQGPYVLVVDDQNVVQRRGVKLGMQLDDQRIVEEGLQKSDWVIVSGLLRAIPGRKVNPQKETTSDAAGSSASKAPQTEAGKTAQ